MPFKIHIVDSVKRYTDKLDEKAKKGLLQEPQRGIVMTPETFSKVFSPERIKLLQKIHTNNITSIYHLAQELEKPYEVVFRNIKYLKGIGLIKLIQKDKRKIPSLSGALSIQMFASQDIET